MLGSPLDGAVSEGVLEGCLGEAVCVDGVSTSYSWVDVVGWVEEDEDTISREDLCRSDP